MKILLSNDDGVLAPGIRALADALQRSSFVDSVRVVAPDRNQSGCSSSLTLNKPLYAQHLENGFVAIDGTPADCVHLGLTGLVEGPTDFVVAGINAGANLGDDVLYSGTVAAAMEGRFLGKPAIAISLVDVGEHKALTNYDVAAKKAVGIISSLSDLKLAEGTILNINIPDVPESEIQGVKVTHLGKRRPPKAVVPTVDPRGKSAFWIGAAGEHLNEEGSDFDMVYKKYISVTPIHLDMTRYQEFDKITQRLELIK